LNILLTKNTLTEIIPDIDLDIVNDKVLIQISDTVYLSYIILDRDSDNSFIHEINFFFKTQDDYVIVNEITEKLWNSS
jgi:hypothetical protein